jgi:hypothetical protein
VINEDAVLGLPGANQNDEGVRAGERSRGGAKSSGGVPYGVGIDDEGRRGLQIPAINFAGLAASRAGGGKGDGAGVLGFL